MEKLIKQLVVLIVVAGVAIGAFVYLSSNSGKGAVSDDGGATAKNEGKKQPKKMRVEEKWGVTSEGLGP